VELWGLYILCGALLLDALAGEAPNRFHPVAGLGKLVSFELKFEPSSGARRQFFFGTAMVILTCAAVAVPLYFGLSYLLTLNPVIYVILSAYLLKNTFALRGLWQAVEEVKLCIRRDDTAGARLKSRALVSRDTSNLSDEQLMSAAVESCAENLCDSFVAPLFYFAIFGLPGAIAYRIINTFDAMIGYRGRWEYTGKFAARLDDILNFIPARLSALLIVTASGICQADAATSWRTMLSQHRRTESPNAGWSMCAMAGSLGITLEKAGAYCLDGGGAALSVAAVTQSQAVMLTSACMWGIIIAAAEVMLGLAR
jgi:adenosylcobinamide-phosphate synthase